MSEPHKPSGRRKETPASLTLEQAWDNLIDELETMADETTPTSGDPLEPTPYADPLFPGHPVFDAVVDVENVLKREGFITGRERLPSRLRRTYWHRLRIESRRPVEERDLDELSAAAHAMADAVKAERGNWTRKERTPRPDWWTFKEAWQFVLNNCSHVTKTEAAAQSELNRWCKKDPSMTEGKQRNRRIDPAKVRQYCKAPPQ